MWLDYVNVDLFDTQVYREEQHGGPWQRKCSHRQCTSGSAPQSSSTAQAKLYKALVLHSGARACGLEPLASHCMCDERMLTSIEIRRAAAILVINREVSFAAFFKGLVGFLTAIERRFRLA